MTYKFQGKTWEEVARDLAMDHSPLTAEDHAVFRGVWKLKQPWIDKLQKYFLVRCTEEELWLNLIPDITGKEEFIEYKAWAYQLNWHNYDLPWSKEDCSNTKNLVISIRHNLARNVMIALVTQWTGDSNESYERLGTLLNPKPERNDRKKK